MNKHFHLAQLNVAKMRFALDAPEMSDFIESLDRINGLAERAPGFVWRLKTAEGDATSLRPMGPDKLVNLSLWKDIDSLHHFVYRADHMDMMRRRQEWFTQMDEAITVLWWVIAGHIPTIGEAVERLDRLRYHGPGPKAFGFRQAKDFPPEI